MRAGREGVNVNGQAISIIGDNIANASTTGYRTSRVEFSDLLGDVEGSGAEVPGVATSGSGVAIARVRQIHETGVIEPTGRSLDVGITGGGFFMLGDPAAPTFTRAGNFSINAAGNLSSPDGREVLGLVGEATALSPISLFNVNTAGAPTSAAAIFGNLDSTSPVVAAVPANPATFVEINAAASFVMPNLTVYDSLGGARNVTIAFFKTDVNTYTAQAYMDAGETGGVAGTPVQLGANATLTFSPNGRIEEANRAAAAITATPAYAGGAAPGNFTIDLSAFSQVATVSQLSSVTQDGLGTGEVVDYQIGEDGIVSATLASGRNVAVGRIQLATFPNLDGLNRIGSNSFEAGADTGELQTGQPGAGGFGTLQGKSLERSTVDITDQFVNLVVYQRGYQASSQALNTANTLIRDTLGLLR
jgi:flagellar hook protein FlgE